MSTFLIDLLTCSSFKQLSRSTRTDINVTCDQALPLSLITYEKEGLKHSFDRLLVKRTDSDLFSPIG